MDRVRRVRPPLVGVPEVRKVRGEGVPVEEEHVVGVDGADGVVHGGVEGHDAGVLRVGGLVERVVPGYPFVVFVVLGELGPEPEDAVLVVFVVPD